ncbi:MAG: glycosyltransferase 87 family protein [Acidobacteriota bacterium]
MTRTWSRRHVFLVCRLALVVIFLSWFASFYKPGFGFTSVLQFNRRGADTRIERLRDVPIDVQPGAGYDGQYYAQLAVDPLLRDSSIDAALDSPPFRARRILFSWTAWLMGLGRPSWVVQAYSVQNALFWIAFAVWLRWRLPGDTVEDLFVWTACLFTPGMLDSTRLALIDGPSACVLAVGVEAIERGRLWAGSIVLGVAGLARETNLLAGVALWPKRFSVRAIAAAAGAALLVILPTLIWFDYLRSIYRSTVTQSLDQLSMPFVAYQDASDRLYRVARRAGFVSPRALPWLAFVGTSAQALYVLAIHRWRSAWWRVGVAFICLMMVIRPEIWLGAYLRVLLPLTLAFNLSLPRDRSFWPVFVLGNLGLATSVRLIASAFG